MNTIMRFDDGGLWQLAGWTMLHFAWIGSVIGLVAFACWVITRRAPANARYVVALGCLLMLAGTPGGVAAWLVVHGFANSVRDDAPVKARNGEVASNPVAPADAHPRIAADSTRGNADVVPTEEPVGIPSRPALPAIPMTAMNRHLSQQFTAALEPCAEYLPWLWLIGAPLTLILLSTGVVGAERLRRASRLIDDGPIVEARDRLMQAMHLTRRVAVAVCERVAAPVLVGIVRPIILLPPAALTGWSTDEIEMVLLHELAHVRRWDNLVNLAQRLIESLLFFHPAVWLVSGWVRREREACCDAVVIGRTARPHAYAELLVALAAQMPRSVLFHRAASSAMAAGPLRGRIRRILQLEDDPMLISGKSFALLVGSVVVAATLAVLYLPARGQAKESVPQGKQELTAVDAEEKSARDNDVAAPNLADPTQVDEKQTDVPVVQGATSFKDGDSITILEVRGTAKTFKPGNIYWIKGTYTLRSHDRAMLAANTTAMDAAHGTSPSLSVQSTNVDRGEGTFTLFLPMLYRGWPHVSFYADGESFGGVYFGTGDSLLKQWWGSNEAVDSTATNAAESAEKHQSDEDARKVSIKIDDNHTATAESQPGRLRLQIRRTEGKSGKFPSLEEQKLADLAWKRLGLELEPLDEAYLKQVKALGYDGGVRVTSVRAKWDDGIWPGDLLVGLHAWPTTSLKDAAEVLNRDDLSELSPLKFYAVRPGHPRNGAFVSGSEQDSLVTGRIAVSFDDHRTAQVEYRPQQTVGSTIEDALKSDPNMSFLNQQLMQVEYSLGEQGKVSTSSPEGKLRLEKQLAAIQKQIAQYRQQAMQRLQQTQPPAPPAPAAPEAPVAMAIPPTAGMPQAPPPMHLLTAAGDVRVGGKLLAEEVAADPEIAELRQKLMAGEMELRLKSTDVAGDGPASIERLQKQIAELQQSIANQVQKKLSELSNQQMAGLDKAARQAAAEMAAAQIALDRAAKEQDELTGHANEAGARPESANRLEVAKRAFEERQRAVEEINRHVDEQRSEREAVATQQAEAKQEAEEAQREADEAKREAEMNRREAEAEAQQAELEAKEEAEEAHREAEEAKREAEAQQREADEQKRMAENAEHERAQSAGIAAAGQEQHVTITYTPHHAADETHRKDEGRRLLEQLQRQLENADRQMEMMKKQLEALAQQKEVLANKATILAKQLQESSHSRQSPSSPAPPAQPPQPQTKSAD